MSELSTLLSPLTLGALTLRNRVVMAPMTRSRAVDNVPNDLMATYYGQRAGAGLIITEGIAPSRNGLGYARIPGLYSEAQVAGWRKTTDAVHAQGGAIFAQLMHVGRIGHPLNVPEGGELVAPSAVAAAGDMYTDQQGPQPHPVPREMTGEDVEAAIEEYVQAARNAIAAGFDGVELHAANGYLLNQFLNPRSNQRTDAWGGSAENRNRFVIETARRTVAAIGAERVGIRLSPYGVFNDLAPFDGIEEQYGDLAEALGGLKLVYVHLVNHSSMGAPAPTQSVVEAIRSRFGGPILLSGGYNAARAEADLTAGKGALVAFGRPYLANPDLIARFQAGADLNPPDFGTFYTPGAAGYTDYPAL